MTAADTEQPIVVVGATGRQGGQVARRLRERGARVRALTRRPDSVRAEPLRTIGAEVVAADLEDPASLDAAFAGARGLYLVLSPTPGAADAEVRQGRNAARAAGRAGIAHVVFGSAGPAGTRTGVQQWDAKREVADALGERGLPMTVLRPMAFMELMVDRGYYPAMSTWYTMPRLAGDDCRISWLSVRDLGAIAATAFAEPGSFVGRDIRLAADVKTLAECAEIHREVVGRAPRRFPMPLAVFRRFVGEDLIAMWRWLRENPVEVDTSETFAILPEAHDVRSWLRSTTASR